MTTRSSRQVPERFRSEKSELLLDGRRTSRTPRCLSSQRRLGDPGTASPERDRGSLAVPLDPLIRQLVAAYARFALAEPPVVTRNRLPLALVPEGAATRIVPLVAPLGTVAVICEPELTLNGAEVPLKATTVAPVCAGDRHACPNRAARRREGAERRRRRRHRDREVGRSARRAAGRRDAS